jgi:outer membrane protein OmpA-like peptidoglycan-associated protein
MRKSRVLATEYELSPIQQLSKKSTDNASTEVQSGVDSNIAEPASKSDLIALGWQQQHGNAATIQRLSSMGAIRRKVRPSARAAGLIQRFEGREHRALGNATGRDFPPGALFEGSPALTYGEMVAMSGDFYGSFDHLADPNYVKLDAGKMINPGELPESIVPNSHQRKIDEINQLKHLLELENNAAARGDESFLHNLDTEYVVDPTTGALTPGYDILTGGRYGKLALTNFRHFSVGEAGMTNVDTWRGEHATALQEAWQAGLNHDEKAYNRAMMRNAASNHYLTDAFSSGHMRAPRQQIDRYYRNMMQGFAEKLPDFIADGIPDSIDLSLPLSSLSAYLPASVPLPDISVSIPIPLADTLKAKLRAAGPAIGAKLRPHLYGFIGVAVGGLVAKWLHDADNKEGVMVKSKAHPEPWRAFGDDYMDSSDPGARINEQQAMTAVKEDANEVERMYQMGLAAAVPNTGKQGKKPSQPTTTAPAKAVYFNFDRPRGEGESGSIRGADRPGLSAMATFLKSNNGVTVTLQGWADSRGAADYNQGLSARRISAVQNYLIQQGVDPSKINAQPMGEPQVPTTSANHAEFRRVDLVVNGSPTPAPQGDPSQQQQGQQPAGGEAAPPPMPEIKEFAAQKYIPEVIGDMNKPLPAWKWPEIKDEGLRQQVTDKAKTMVRGVLGGIIEQAIQENLPATIPVNVNIPIIGNVGFDLPVQNIAHKIKDKGVKGVLSALDAAFPSLMDAAAAVGGDTAEAADEKPLTH